MKKGTLIIFFALLTGILFIISLNIVDSYYSKKIDSMYVNPIGDKLLFDKNKGLVLQSKGLQTDNNLFMYGSSEFNSPYIPAHPSHIFSENENGFQVNLIGRGGSQSIIHAINFGALASDLKDQKVVFVLSPQWFIKEGILQKYFLMNFSELQFYSVVFSKDLDEHVKRDMVQRVNTLLSQQKEFRDIQNFTTLYLQDDLFSRITIKALMPYYFLKYQLLIVKDKKEAVDHLILLKDEEIGEKKSKALNWNLEMENAESVARRESSNNDFGIMNSYYNQYIKEKYPKLKDSYKSLSYTESPEYEDLKLLLEISKQEGITPLFINVPVHGKWYDYAGFSKEKRQAYYQKVNQLITSYGFDVADFSQYEYEDYFLKDPMHLGWKGWVYVDETIDRYYHQD